MIAEELIRPMVAERAPLFRPPGYWSERSVYDYLCDAATDGAERLALVDTRQRLSYGEYLARSRRVASWLIDSGLTNDDVLAIQLPNWCEFAITINAAVSVGVPFCQFHSGFSEGEVEFVLRHSGAKAVVVPAEFRGRRYAEMVDRLRPNLPDLEHCVSVGAWGDGAWGDLEVISKSYPLNETGLAARKPSTDDIMRIAFTSGTTSEPKAVVHTHNSSLGTKRQNIIDEHVDEESVVLVFMPVGLNWGLGETIRAAMARCRVIYMDHFDAERAIDLIEAERVTHLSAAPAALVSLMDASNFHRMRIDSLKLVMVGGAPCPPIVAERWRALAPGVLLERYGMLEIGTGARTVVDDDPVDVGSSVGTISPDGQVRIVDESGGDLPLGEVGEILFRGPGVAFGYYKNAAATADAFLPGGWFRTGDLGYVDGANRLYIAGRRKEMLIRAGANVYPREIEEALLLHPAVADCAIVGVPDERVGERIGAVVVPRDGQSVTLGIVRDFLATRVASYKQPELLYLLDELPRTPTGKVQRHLIDLKALREAE